uniref:Uncharacterized protein n=1 Tax=Lotharella oceanica TaxID=641309 RepID=A0A7S2U4U3_9EUKA|mmetsp:Transcript_8747/g.17156  ORF Transcript_8747/g.17156 Transcript_8747/m.17156 type:complete len:294 (+) Transcript_8747:72-953(+)|eukprot:CAMPEP_0170183448 /NCGR_PEP_ID=MMETSP0040_2-20121228/30753_1 /TAXON_ID=641309 /ORGANISM="Lotharella oceanica, Strain CCMP622" /LENGTH=293 /DNA_ID=CAMNT_0010429185 /DNA_START=62 /DNA_END=943 /DNA_ORIENTATION=+
MMHRVPTDVQICYEDQPPRVWYKDQAHEPKYFDVTVALKDTAGRAVKGLDVPLKAELLYDNGAEVKRQTILKLSKDSIPKIGRSGVAEMKIRIDSVSKNHDNHDFMVRISADNSYVPPNLIVKPSTSQPITVRSKRNRGKRKKSEGPDTDSLRAIASWCRFAKDIMLELSSQDESCPSCHFIEPRHAPKCRLNSCLLGYKHIQSLLESKAKFQEPKRHRPTPPKFTAPSTLLDTPPRFPMLDLKRDRSPKLSLENIHNIMPVSSESTPGSFDEFFGQPPKLLKQPILQRKKSG